MFDEIINSGKEALKNAQDSGKEALKGAYNYVVPQDVTFPDVSDNSPNAGLPSIAERYARYSGVPNNDFKDYVEDGKNWEQMSDLASAHGALRHVVWQAALVKDYGLTHATLQGTSHEYRLWDSPEVALSDDELKKRSFSSLKEADTIVDQRNNVIGRGVGQATVAKNPSADYKTLAMAGLDDFHTNGYYAAIQNPDKTFSIQRMKLTDEQYTRAKENIARLDQYGYHPEIDNERYGKTPIPNAKDTIYGGVARVLKDTVDEVVSDRRLKPEMFPNFHPDKSGLPKSDPTTPPVKTLDDTPTGESKPLAPTALSDSSVKPLSSGDQIPATPASTKQVNDSTSLTTAAPKAPVDHMAMWGEVLQNPAHQAGVQSNQQGQVV